jgi:peptidoglycan-N-acetylglucosamine deacetylase
MRVALTFDTEFAGRPTQPGGEDRILETLASAGIRGTFFLQGRWVRRDIAKAEETILATTGVDPKPWFRCPFGAGMDDPRVLAAIEELGYQHVGWEHDPRDWEEGRTVDELVAGVGPGIVLLHAWPTVTADGLGRVIAGLREQGAEFVGVDEIG